MSLSGQADLPVRSKLRCLASGAPLQDKTVLPGVYQRIQDLVDEISINGLQIEAETIEGGKRVITPLNVNEQVMQYMVAQKLLEPTFLRSQLIQNSELVKRVMRGLGKAIASDGIIKLGEDTFQCVKDNPLVVEVNGGVEYGLLNWLFQQKHKKNGHLIYSFKAQEKLYLQTMYKYNPADGGLDDTAVLTEHLINTNMDLDSVFAEHYGKCKSQIPSLN